MISDLRKQRSRGLLVLWLLLAVLAIPAADANTESGQSSYHCKTNSTLAHQSAGYAWFAQAAAPFDTLSCTSSHSVKMKVWDVYAYQYQYPIKSASISSPVLLVDNAVLFCSGAWWRGNGMPDHYDWQNLWDPMSCHG